MLNTSNLVTKTAGYGLLGQGSILGRGRDFSFRHHVQKDSEATQPPMQL